MSTLADRCKEWWPGMCGAGFDLTDGLTATQIYNGVTRPDFWAAVYSHVEAEAETTNAFQLMLDVLQDAATLHGSGDLKTRINALTVADDAATLEEHRYWAQGRKKTGTRDGPLERAFFELVRWLQVPRDPKRIQIPLRQVVAYYMEAQAVDMQTARTTVYAYMRSQVDETTFKGPNT